jgi:hypothetical protein
MNVRQVRVHDLVRKVNTSSLGVVDRTDKEVSSHVPEPQADYLVDVTRHRSVSKNDYKTFLRLGKVCGLRGRELLFNHYILPKIALGHRRLVRYLYRQGRSRL